MVQMAILHGAVDEKGIGIDGRLYSRMIFGYVYRGGAGDPGDRDEDHRGRIK